ncbi:TonB-linked outer membrane protein, SusC/RagA family [Zobellia uliginosa]|uniref:TonB-linked outer membrane protein, SusC/RagA family n=1 Tax=Zobellia uliginosa TaxID=143224 RepID=A0ABY1KM05_9FLAO|nr:TonB-dependent receptor [Zobellia uliginosa]SIS48714.1 TonB-linked outer membrane protein, SusC/RagA family [Zobellia uliginosa]
MKIKWFTDAGCPSNSIKRLLVLKFAIILAVTIPMQSHAFSKTTESPLENDLTAPPVQRTVSGTVSDAMGPLAGVTILVKGSTKGTSTDFDGNYNIEVDAETTLVYSYIGYSSKEIKVGSQTEINVTLEEDAAKLEEVVVLGYSTKKKGEVTGSVSTIDNKAIEQSSSKDVAKSLAGRASGLIISDRGGVPGAGNGGGGSTDDDATTILIRGKSTLGNNTPLILIDGVPSGSFSQLAPQDIESLTVLKDGAAAIYGSRAANGVILVTTKRGKSGKPKINFSHAYNVSSFTKRPELMDVNQFATYENEINARVNGADADLVFTPEDIAGFPNTDWADEVLAKTSPESRTSLSVSGGAEKAKYFVSGDFIDQKGLYKSGALGFKQYQLRSNIDVNLSDSFKLGVDLATRFGKRTAPGVNANNIYKLIFALPPNEIARYPNGLPARGGDEGNPILTSSNASGFEDNFTNTTTGRFTADWNLDKVLKGLSIKGFTGFRKIETNSKSWYSPWTFYAQLDDGTFEPRIGSNQQGTERILTERFSKFDEQIYNARLHYDNTFGVHSISTFIGMERLNNASNNFFATKVGGFPDARRGELFQGNNDDRQASGGTSSEFKRQDFFGSLSYDFKKKYFIDFTMRYDGSSRFGEGNRYGTFPSAAVSWAMDKESFLENVAWIDGLKLRASLSKMGNDRIGANQFLSLFDLGTNTGNAINPLGTRFPNYYVLGEGGESFVNTYNLARLANPDVTWETAQLWNIGLNFTLFDNKLSGDFNYYEQDRSDILVNRSGAIPGFIGLQNSQIPAENIGKTRSWGYEFELAWNDEVTDNFSYNLGVNFTNARNEVVSLPEGENILDSQKQAGKPIDSYNRVFPTNGIFKDQAQVDATSIKREGTVPGEPIYIDVNDDGVVDGNDFIRTSTSNIPQIQYGIYGGFNYKSFGFNFLFQGQAEAETLVFFDQSGAKPEFVFNERWTPNNTNSIYPRAFAQGDAISGGQIDGTDGFADLYYFDASFVRLKEVELSYTLKSDVIKFADVRLFARGFNLATFFSDIWDLGLDPEATGYNNFRGAQYTPLKTYTLGVNFSF